MKPELKALFLMLVEGVELHKGGVVLKYSDPEVIVLRGRKELYCGEGAAQMAVSGLTPLAVDGGDSPA
jgi:hypothetical protein